MFRLPLAILAISCAQFIFGQTIFLETFGEGDGATSGTDDVGGVSWTASCPACVSGDYFEILSGQMEGLDTNGPATWETGIIDISSCDKISISFDLSEIGTMEGCGDGCDATDWVALEYNIDGTGWTTPSNSYFCAGPCADLNVIQSDDIAGDAMVYTTGCMEGGSTLQIRITLQTWAGSEAWQFDNVTVECETGPSIDAGIDQVICDGESTTLTASNPDGAIISWSGGITDGVSFTPPSGTNTYTVTATLGECTNTDDVTVTVTAGATAGITPVGPYTISSPSVTLSGSPSGGTWSSDCGPCLSSSGVFNPSVAGVGVHNICYTVGAPPCDDTHCISITVNPDGGCTLVGTVSGSNPTCFGDSDGSATINTSGGITPITFVITNEAGDLINISNSNTANGLGEGWYYFDVTDDNGCNIIDSIFIEEPEQLDIDLTLVDPLCYNIPTGIAIVDTVYNFQGDYLDVSYYWSPNPMGEEGLGADTLYNGPAGDYSVIINDDFGCSRTFDFTLTYPEELVFSEIGFEPAYCRVFGYQSGNGVVYAAAGGGTPDYTYEWLNESTGDVTSNTTWGGLNPGNYTITITDDNGCVLTETILLDSLNPIADFTITSGDFEGPNEGTAPVFVEFTNSSQNFANPINPNADTTFFWNFGFGNYWVLSHDFFQEFDTTYFEGGVYEVCLVATNKNGCTDTACKPITIYNELLFTPLNIFTPNNDGKNDIFTFDFKSKAVAEFECIIVNRWGNTMYIMNGITDGWNGMDEKGNPCPNGVYFYKYSGRAENGEEFEGQGSVQLIGN